ncbi:invasion associated locus B family protein [Brucella intermedia]|uniref:invasion associated locus B family protein n=1 Tax=Brucella intermedia TaxID=94625 RepID=UPI001F3CF50F|nr:invasion associated locus B family protein [Brucella intermedia]
MQLTGILMRQNKHIIRTITQVAISVAVLSMVTRVALAEQGALPGGASSLQETYQDWSVGCRLANGAKKCLISQTQNQNGQRLLALELQSGKDQNAEGILLLPFGLKLGSGVILTVDDKPGMAPLQFSTCLPTGCLVPLTFDAKTLAGLRAGKAIKIATQRVDGPAMTFSVSLNGFATGFDRVAALGK